MATQAIEGKKVNAKIKLNLRDLASNLLASSAEVAYDFIITVTVTGLALAIMSGVVHPYLFQVVSGFYITAMLIVLLIRILHRFDEGYTLNELAERLIEMEHTVNEKLDRVIDNV